MSEETTAVERPQSTKLSARNLFARDDIKAKFNELLGKRSTAFITSVLQIVSQSDLLAKADPMSVYQCAAMAATLDMPLNANIGHSYIIPFKEKSGLVKAQFIIGYKGYKQLALRNGYKNKSGLEVKKHTDAEKYFWQCVSNACLENLPKAELLIFCPYLSDLPELADFISNLDDVDLQIRAEWIHSAIINENYDALPWIPDGGFYKSLNAIVFDVPDADRIFLTYRVQQLSPLLIKRS